MRLWNKQIGHRVLATQTQDVSGCEQLAEDLGVMETSLQHISGHPEGNTLLGLGVPEEAYLAGPQCPPAQETQA